MVAYLDLIILLNWFFDCLLLYWSSLLIKRKVSLIRIAFGGAIGALFIAISFTSFYTLTNSVLAKLVVSLIMIFITFGYKRMKVYAKACLTFYFVTFLTGGILIGIHFLFSYQLIGGNMSYFYMTKSFGDPISWMFVIFGFPITWMYSKKVFADMEVTQAFNQGIVTVVIKIKDQVIQCNGLIDTGNQLYEPLTNIPVMILSTNLLREKLPSDVENLLEQPIFSNRLSTYTNSSWGERIRLIPYKVVGSDQQLLIAFRPDWIKIIRNGETGIVQRGLVGLTKQQLSHDGGFDCIIHPKMVISMGNQTA